MAVLITESVDTLTGTLEKTGAKRFRIKIIDEGVGSSGTYPGKTLEQAAKDKIFAKGTHMYLDHPTALETMDRPERTVKDLAAVLDNDAVYESGALYADIRAYSAHAGVIEEMKDDIGVSIRASAEVEEASGTRIITRLVEAQSVDFVTRAGRGGKVMDVLESARVTHSAISHGVAEATANQTREMLSRAVKDAHGGANRYTYVRDFDETNVWFNASSDYDEGSKIWQRTYTVNATAATLTGDPVEVRSETSYVPVTTPTVESKNSPPIPAGVTERKEPIVATTQIEEAELATLKQDAGRVTALESDNADLRKSVAEAVIAEAFAGLEAPRTKARILESFTATGSTMTTDALRAEATESAAEIKVLQGAGKVDGVGDTTAVDESKTITDDDIVNAL
ncbi:hypothetical protein ASF21_12855 [Arthrobacter sp. Leaf234]|uniref:hypothetical protein n=1 Tax=Arthrobacter sp. Leaf234 TaxID=1736303 RepID=UPI0006F3DDEC|nr:hypothetical protein [Arthrobacter sp. Leaf234]KQN99691.1 hypothetical protein ASF21_12855 [Arthrobacter sp. Leaf234]